MIALLLIIIAAICKAVADTIAHHYYDSMFNGSKFFNPNIQGKKLPFTNYPFDGWHLSNSVMIIAFVLAAVFHTPLLKWYYEIVIAGAVFNLTFNLFYNKLLR